MGFGTYVREILSSSEETDIDFDDVVVGRGKDYDHAREAARDELPYAVDSERYTELREVSGELDAMEGTAHTDRHFVAFGYVTDEQQSTGSGAAGEKAAEHPDGFSTGDDLYI